MPVFKSGISIPPKQNPIRPKGTKKYAWLANWKVMDCIEVDTEEDCQRIDGAVRKFDLVVCRVSCHAARSTENGQTFYRIWRIA